MHQQTLLNDLTDSEYIILMYRRLFQYQMMTIYLLNKIREKFFKTDTDVIIYDATI